MSQTTFLLRTGAFAIAICWGVPALAQTVVVCAMKGFGGGTIGLDLDNASKTLVMHRDAFGHMYQTPYALTPRKEKSGRDEVSTYVISTWSGASISFGRHVQDGDGPGWIVDEYVLDRVNGTLTYTYRMRPTEQLGATGTCERKKQVF